MKLEIKIYQNVPATAKKPAENVEFNMVVSSRKEFTKELVLEQVKARIAMLLALRIKTKQKCGLNLAQPIGFIFKVGSKVINTMKIAESCHVTLKVANSKSRRQQFYRNIEAVTEFGLSLTKVYSKDEFDALNESIDAHVEELKQIRLTKKVSEEAVISAN